MKKRLNFPLFFDAFINYMNFLGEKYFYLDDFYGFTLYCQENGFYQEFFSNCNIESECIIKTLKDFEEEELILRFYIDEFGVGFIINNNDYLNFKLQKYKNHEQFFINFVQDFKEYFNNTKDESKELIIKKQSLEKKILN